MSVTGYSGGGFTGLFIQRSVATTLIMLAITIFGAVAYKFLPVSDLPNVDLPTLVVNASLPGANAETMASAIATPLERQFSTIEGLDSMNSTNSLGSTAVTLRNANAIMTFCIRMGTVLSQREIR